MAWEDFLNHTCDLYHVVSTDTTPGYGLPGTPKHSYANVPDLVDVPCHFKQGSSGVVGNTIKQELPQKDYNARLKVVFPAGTDVRLNDKVVDHRTGMVYYAEIPRTIYGQHHVYVWVNREGPEEHL